MYTLHQNYCWQVNSQHCHWFIVWNNIKKIKSWNTCFLTSKICSICTSDLQIFKHHVLLWANDFSCFIHLKWVRRIGHLLIIKTVIESRLGNQQGLCKRHKWLEAGNQDGMKGTSKEGKLKRIREGGKARTCTFIHINASTL